MEKSSTAEFMNPIYTVENDCIINVYGDYTIGYELGLPEVFTVDLAVYEAIHTAISKAIAILSPYTVIHKQDWFMADSVQAETTHTEPTFLQKSYNRHFAGRPYMAHRSCIYISKTTKYGLKKQSITTTLARGALVPQEVLSKEIVERFFEEVGLFESIIRESGVKLRRLTAEDYLGTDTEFGIFDIYQNLSNDGVLADIYVRPDRIIIGDKHVSVHALSDLDDFPTDISTAYVHDKLSTDKTQCMLSYGAPLGILLQCNHIYNQYIFIDDSGENLQKLDNLSKRMIALAKYSRSNVVNYENVQNYIEHSHRERSASVRFHANVMAWSNADDYLKTRNEVGGAMTKMGITPRVVNVDIPFLFYSAFPGNAADFPSEDTVYSFIEPSVCFFNLESIARSSLSPFGIRLSDRVSGRPLHVDLSDEPMKSQVITNRNKFILGPSGSGKSFFTNHLVRQYYEQGTHVLLIDIGHSYRSLCQYINHKTRGEDGVYYTYTDESPISFNPFYVENNEFDLGKEESILTLLITLWKRESETLKRAEMTILGDILNVFIKKIISGELVNPDFNAFYEYLLTIDVKSVREKDFDLTEFITVLKPYYKGGKFGYLLNSPMNIDLLNKRFVVFELDNIKGNEILFAVVTIIIMESFINKMKKLDGVRKMIVIEEAWKAIARQGMAEYIKELFKTVRKYYGEAVIVTQEVDDIIHSDIVRHSIINNSDCKILLDQRKYLNRFDDIQSLLGLSDKQKAQILSINLDNRPNAKYKEVYIDLGGVQSGVFGIELSPEEYAIYTTEQSERTEINHIQARFNGNIELAARQYAENSQNQKNN